MFISSRKNDRVERALMKARTLSGGQLLTLFADEAETVRTDAWGENSRSSYTWMKSGMVSLPAQSSSYSAIRLRDESVINEQAALMMKMFDRRSPSRKRGRYGKADADMQRFFKTSTCEEIRHSAGELSRAEDADVAAFTAYYERARYQLRTDPTDEDAERMAELFAKIRKVD